MSHVPKDGTKTCRRCETVKPVDAFRPFKMNGDRDREYRKSWCRMCEIEYSRQWRKKNPGYDSMKAKRYRSL